MIKCSNFLSVKFFHGGLLNWINYINFSLFISCHKEDCSWIILISCVAVDSNNFYGFLVTMEEIKWFNSFNSSLTEWCSCVVIIYINFVRKKGFNDNLTRTPKFCHTSYKDFWSHTHKYENIGIGVTLNTLSQISKDLPCMFYHWKEIIESSWLITRWIYTISYPIFSSNAWFLCIGWLQVS